MSILFALAALASPVACPSPVKAIDGDTVKCADGVRLRLSGIDTPEMPGHCRKGRDCMVGDPYAAKLLLQNMLDAGKVTYSILTKDIYGRTVAIVWAGNINLNCYQLPVARYMPKWDTGKHVKRLCRIKP
jgi:endonuclease YncB( thermonuclease family)